MSHYLVVAKQNGVIVESVELATLAEAGHTLKRWYLQYYSEVTIQLLEVKIISEISTEHQ